jgi:hypothetical protein
MSVATTTNDIHEQKCEKIEQQRRMKKKFLPLGVCAEKVLIFIFSVGVYPYNSLQALRLMC